MWADLRRRPSHLAVLVLCAVGVVVHQAVRWDWFIDDAAIVFAYADNIARGEGVVPWPGAERIEGVSDPTWTALLAAFAWFGLHGFEVSKPLGMLFSVLCLPLAYRTARLAMPDHDGPAPLFAPIALALSAQFAIWGASGLENALWCFVLAAAIHATILDVQRGRFLASSCWFLLLAWTRPEGVLYAAIGGCWFLVALWWRGQPVTRPVLGWLAVFWLPTLALEALRLWYFAWPVANTWYAKVAVRPTAPLDWNGRGWWQAREYASRLWQGWYLPLYAVGLLGLEGRRARVGLGLVALSALTLVYPAPGALANLWFWPDLPVYLPWVVVRMGLFVLTGLALPLLAVGGRGWEAKALCGSFAVTSVLFSVYAGGDWMGAYRWMSLMAPNLAVLLAVGLATLADAVEARATGARAWGTAGWLVVAFGLCALIPPNFSQTRDHVYFNFNETPLMVKRRVDATREVLRRTMYDGPVYNLDMDMGAHLVWAPDYVHVDMAGLVDIPMSRHWYGQRPFIDEYVFREHPPTFAHVHGWWSQSTKLKTYDGFADLVEIPPYRDLEGMPPHDGVWVRRTLFVAPAWEGPGPRVAFEGGPVLHGLELPTGAWPRGADGYLEAAFSTDRAGEPDAPFRVVAFVADGQRVASWDLPLGYGYLPVAGWKPGEVFVGRFPLRVPDDLPEGTYDLGFVVLGGDGSVRSPVEPPSDLIVGTASDARYAAGEVRFPGAVTVGTRADRDARADALLADAVAAAEGGRCEAAEDVWRLTRRHRPRDHRWAGGQRPPVARALADCWARRGTVEDLARAHRWDHRSPVLAEVGAPVGERLWQEGLAAREAEDWEVAYARFEAVLSFQPWRSWARRYAEEARDARLGLGPPDPNIAPGDRPADDIR